MEHLSKKGSSQEVCVEECISKGVFWYGHQRSFASFRKQAKSSRTTRTAISRLPTAISRTRFPRAISLLWIGRNKTEQTSFSLGTKVRSLDPQRNEASNQTYRQVQGCPLIVAPGQEDEYLEVRRDWMQRLRRRRRQNRKETPDSSTEEATPSVVQQEESLKQTKMDGTGCCRVLD